MSCYGSFAQQADPTEHDDSKREGIYAYLIELQMAQGVRCPAAVEYWTIAFIRIGTDEPPGASHPRDEQNQQHSGAV